MGHLSKIASGSIIKSLRYIGEMQGELKEQLRYVPRGLPLGEGMGKDSFSLIGSLAGTDRSRGAFSFQFLCNWVY